MKYKKRKKKKSTAKQNRKIVNTHIHTNRMAKIHKKEKPHRKESNAWQ